MAVAETQIATRTPRTTQSNLGVTSLLSGALALLGLWLIFGGLPYFWNEFLRMPERLGAVDNPNYFLSAAILLIITGLVITGFWMVGLAQLNRAHLPGLRAGTVYSALLMYIALWAVISLGNALEARGYTSANGGVLVAALGAILLGAIGWLFLRPACNRWLEQNEANGWFHGTSFKGNQGVRVRRSTIVGLLTLGFCGIYTLVTHHSFGVDTKFANNDYYWKVPFTQKEDETPQVERREGAATDGSAASGYLYIPILYKVHMILPILMALLLVWLAWRLVNQPTFADFLIATEAEMNKVSWTTRKRLIQDTIVVLVTVVLMTLFLFLIDLLWIKALTSVGVLHVDPNVEKQKQRQKSQW